jgi:hypothetical protein
MIEKIEISGVHIYSYNAFKMFSSNFDPTLNMSTIETYSIPNIHGNTPPKYYKYGKVAMNEPDHCWLIGSTERYKYWNVSITLDSGNVEILLGVNIEMIGMCSRTTDKGIIYGVGIPSSKVIVTSDGKEAKRIMKHIRRIIKKIYDAPTFLSDYVMDW